MKDDEIGGTYCMNAQDETTTKFEADKFLIWIQLTLFYLKEKKLIETHNTITLPFALQGCATSSLILREEARVIEF
jgi:hypothetical protein